MPNLISSDSDARRIYVHSGISATILTSFASPGTAPTGVCLDTLPYWRAADNQPLNLQATFVNY